MSRTFLYTRVSTDEQSVDAQEQALLKRFPDGTVIRETASGVKHRPILENLLAGLQRGDTLVVVALDRLGRTMVEVITLLDDLQRRGVIAVSLRESLDYSTPVGRMVAQILASVAELERNIIVERTKAGMQAAKARGVHVGRPFRRLDQETIDAIKGFIKLGYTMSEIVPAVGVSERTIYRILKEQASSEDATGPATSVNA